MDNALKALEQAKARVANERKEMNEKRRKEENHHKYLMGGIIVKYFPECYCFDETELNRILSVALATRECRQIIENIKKASSENVDIYQNKNARRFSPQRNHPSTQCTQRICRPSHLMEYC